MSALACTMLRPLVLILLLANAAFLAWSQGLLRPWGLAPATQAEPQRLARQIQPQALRLLSPEEARRLLEAPQPPSSAAAGP